MKLDVTVNLYVHGGEFAELSRKLDRVLNLLGVSIRQGEQIMALADDIKAAIANLDAETTAVGANVAALAAKIKNTMSDQEVADVQAGFKALSDRLTVLAQDPTQPVPPAPPALQALRRKI